MSCKRIVSLQRLCWALNPHPAVPTPPLQTLPLDIIRHPRPCRAHRHCCHTRLAAGSVAGWPPGWMAGPALETAALRRHRFSGAALRQRHRPCLAFAFMDRLLAGWMTAPIKGVPRVPQVFGSGHETDAPALSGGGRGGGSASLRMSLCACRLNGRTCPGDGGPLAPQALRKGLATETPALLTGWIGGSNACQLDGRTCPGDGGPRAPQSFGSPEMVTPALSGGRIGGSTSGRLDDRTCAGHGGPRAPHVSRSGSETEIPALPGGRIGGSTSGRLDGRTCAGHGGPRAPHVSRNGSETETPALPGGRIGGSTSGRLDCCTCFNMSGHTGRQLPRRLGGEALPIVNFCYAASFRPRSLDDACFTPDKVTLR